MSSGNVGGYCGAFSSGKPQICDSETRLVRDPEIVSDLN